MTRDKRNLKAKNNVEIVGQRMLVRSVAHITTLAWRISNYEELRYNVMHFKACKRENVMCIFRLFKYNKTLHLSVSGVSVLGNFPAEFSILNEVSLELITEQAVRIASGVIVGSVGVFVAKFPEEIFLSEKFSFLTGGILTVTFKYTADYGNTIWDSDLKAPEILTNRDDVCYDLKRMYLDSLFPDFNIHVKKYTFKSHKVILTNRSKYFSDILKSDKDKLDHRLPDDTMLGILNHVLLYMYCGELMEWDEDFMLHVYKLAVFLNVKALCTRCLKYFEKQVTNDNCKMFFEFASKFQLIELKNIIIRMSVVKFKDILAAFTDTEKLIQEKGDTLEDKSMPQK